MQAFSLKSDPSIMTIIKEESDENNFVEPPVSVTSASMNSLSVLGSFSSTAVPSNSSVTNTNIISTNTTQNDVSLPNLTAIKQQIHQLNQQDAINRITLHQQQSAQTLLPFELLPQNNEASASLLTSANVTDSTSILTPLELIAKEKGGITVNMDCLNTLLSFVCCPTCHSPVNHKETIQGFKTGILYSLQLFCINGHLIGNTS